ncbi:uncharacterized protein LOC135368814 isoform X2 [Ornithodoros turicata]|uniref:uncharacterized protein LOC135368814 isoform X2 n=1 Tax=Ornithodoros turicata TaxID=34597 RepID=UPI003138EB14
MLCLPSWAFARRFRRVWAYTDKKQAANDTELGQQLWIAHPQHHASAIGIVLPLDNAKMLTARSVEKPLVLQLRVYFNYDVQYLLPMFVRIPTMPFWTHQP